jgi:hypothetical protein
MKSMAAEKQIISIRERALNYTVNMVGHTKFCGLIVKDSLHMSDSVYVGLIIIAYDNQFYQYQGLIIILIFISNTDLKLYFLQENNNLHAQQIFSSRDVP